MSLPPGEPPLPVPPDGPPTADWPPPPSPHLQGPEQQPQSETWTQTFKDLVQFVRDPQLELPKPEGGRSGIFGFLIRMVGIDLVLRILSVPFVLIGTLLLDGAEYSALDVPEGEELNKLVIFLFAAVAAPILEEASMRLQIHRFSEWRFWLSSLLWFVFVIGTAWESGRAFLWLPAVFPIAMVVWRLFAAATKRTQSSWNGNPARVVWFTTLGFAILHVANYDIPVNNWRLVTVVLLVVPQLVGGLAMAYTRVRVGYWGSVAHHAIGNALLISLVLTSL